MSSKKPTFTKPSDPKTSSASSAPQGGAVSDWFKKDISRRSATNRIGKGLAWSAVLGMAGVSVYMLASDDEEEVTKDSLDLQRSEGWNVGSTDKTISLYYTQSEDSLKRKDWTDFRDPNRLIAALQPASSAWQPYFVPTLMQSLAQESLRSKIEPIINGDMQAAYGRAQALGELIAQSENPGQTLIVADLKGDDAVAFGAALAGKMHIVPVFDNWPHPLGVVPSHQTLGAMFFHAREIEEKKGQTPAQAPAVLLLDSNRLNAYKDEENQFDNRYMAKVPSADELKKRGVANVMYVVKDDTVKEELDDLNDEFVEWQKQGINVKMLRLSEFKPSNETLASGTPATGTGAGTSTVVRNNYYYGGSPFYHWWFYNHYFYRPYPTVIISRGGYNYPLSRPTTPPPFNPPAYRPVSRQTMFSGSRVGARSGVGRTRPTGFGRTSVRTSGGRVTGVRSGRSGSYGRSGGWFGG
jgi:hypothetical protein